MTSRRLLAASVLWPLSAALAQSASVHGRVSGPDGSPVVEAVASLAVVGDSAWRHQRTDRTGAFRFADLPAGAYRIQVRRIGFRPHVDTLTLAGGDERQLAIRLEAAPRELDPLVVAAERGVSPDRLDPGFRRDIGPEELALLPLPNEVRSIIRLLPGVRPDQVWGAATAQANNYQLDGIWINHPGAGADLLQPNVTWVDRIEVKGLGTGAEFGDFQGGLVNVVTRSGSDRFDGALRVTGESPRLNGSNLRTSEIGAEPGSRWEADGYVRGPLRRGLSYALFGQIVSRDQRVVNHLRQFPDELSPVVPEATERKFLAKLSWQPTGRDALTLTAARLDQDVDRFGLAGFESPEATRRLRSRHHLLNARWERSWSAKSFLEARLGGVFGTDRRDPYNGADRPGLVTINETDPHAYGNAEFQEYRRPTNLSAAIRWTVEHATGPLEHHLKVGGEYQRGTWRYARRRNGGLTWRPGERFEPPFLDPARPATWVFNGAITSTWGGEVDLDAGLDNGALYVQDDIAIGDRLTLHAGARWGRWVGRLAPRGGAPRFTAVEDAALEPRLGVTLALDRRTNVLARVHWGRYHQSIFAGMFDRAQGANVFSNEEQWEYRGPAPADPGARFTRDQRDALARAGLFRQTQLVTLNEVGRVESYRQPYVDQWVAGLEAAIAGRWKAEALYVRRRNRNMVALVDRNLEQNYTVFTDIRVLDRFFVPVHWDGKELVLPRLALSNRDLIYWYVLLRLQLVEGIELPPGLTFEDLGNLTWNPDYALTTVPEATRRFDQVQLRLEGRYPGWWVSASAAVTSLRGNLNSITGNDDASLSGAGPFVRLNEQFQFFGNLSNQSDLELKLAAGARLPLAIQAGAFATWVSGDVATPYLTLSDLLFEFDQPDPADPAARAARLRSFYTPSVNGQRVFIEPRGSFQYGSYGTLDVHLERRFDAGRAGLAVTLDGFNILGAATVTEAQTSLTGRVGVGAVAGYGRTRNRLPPRAIRLGVLVGL